MTCIRTGMASAILISALLGVLSPAMADPASPDLFNLTLEQLMDIRVTSVSKTEQEVHRAAAAVFVLTREDIRRSGATSLPELLRRVPGVHVARIDSNKWSVSVRGFSGMFSNKLLVLIDGRTVYNPFFGGVFWQAQDIVLEDIERIEVIRGPGAALWGANAVNGVINVITRSAKETPGGLVSAGAGTFDQGIGVARYGWSPTEGTAIRVYGKGTRRAELERPDGTDAEDDWTSLLAGFRLDTEDVWGGNLSVQGEIKDVDAGSIRPIIEGTPPAQTDQVTQSDILNGHLLARWSDNATQIQLYYDRLSYDEPKFAVLSYDTIDLDLQHKFSLGERHLFLIGGGYRFIHDHTEETETIEVTDEVRTTHQFNLFLQDTITLAPDRWQLILGTKVEDSNQSDVAWQPSVRLLYTPNPDHTLWGAVSRAVRLPTRAETDLSFNATVRNIGIPLLIKSAGNNAVESEKLLAYEAGYRWKVTPDVALDLAAFYHRYSDLISGETGSPVMMGGYAISTTAFANGIKGRIYGFEGVLNWKPTARLRLEATYAFMETDMKSTEAGQTGEANYDGTSPRHQFGFRSLWNLTDTVELDTFLHFTDETHFRSGSVSTCWNLDLRLGWRPREGLELSVVGQNLLHSQQQEFDVIRYPDYPAEIPRGIFGKVTWEF